MRELRALIEIYDIQRNGIGARATLDQVKRSVNRRAMQVASRVRQKIASRMVRSEPQENSLQHIFRVALAACNTVGDTKNRFMIIAKKNSEFFKLRISRDCLMRGLAFCGVY
jgi:hypothetical protein